MDDSTNDNITKLEILLKSERNRLQDEFDSVSGMYLLTKENKEKMSVIEYNDKIIESLQKIAELAGRIKSLDYVLELIREMNVI